jgi:hypothetical protein
LVNGAELQECLREKKSTKNWLEAHRTSTGRN